MAGRKFVRVKPPAYNPVNTPQLGNVNQLPIQAGHLSEIDKLGLGPEVIRLRKLGLTHEEIGLQLTLSSQQVSAWLDKYRNLPADQQEEVQKRSIFNLTDRLQESLDSLYGLSTKMKNDLDHGGAVKAEGTILKALTLAGSLIEKLEMQRENDRFRNVILDLLDREAPGIKAKALQELAKYREGISALRPL